MSDAAPALTPRRRLHVPFWVRLTLSLVVMVLVIWLVIVPQFSDGEKVFTSLRQLSLPLVLLAVGLELTSLLVYSALTADVLGSNRPSYFTLLRIDVTVLGISHVLPGGGAAAAAVRFRLLGLAGTRSADALTVAAIQTTGSNLMLGAVFAVGVALSLTEVAGNVYYVVAGSLVLALLAAAAVGVWVLTRHTDRSVTVVRAIARRIPFFTEAAGESLVKTMASRIRALITDPRRMTSALVLGAANWLLDAAALGIMLDAFGHRLGLGPLLTVYGVGNLIALLPLTPGGLGLVETVTVSGLVGFGTSAAVALLGVLGWRLLEFWLPIPLAGLAYLSLRLGPLRHLSPLRTHHG